MTWGAPPEVVVFDRFVSEERWGPRVREKWPEAVTVTDTQDLHFLRRARIRRVAWEETSEEFLRELASLYRSDLNLVLSSEEMQLLASVGVPSALLQYTPLFYPGEVKVREWKARDGFAFIGNYRHTPNYEGALWLVKEIWPKIRMRLPHATLTLAGAFAPREISALDSPKYGIRFCGQVTESDAFLARARVNLAPLLSGAGMKGKILSGWNSGTPCVSTTIGAEGMGSPFGGVVENDAGAFAEACLALHLDETLWIRHSEAGLRLIREDFVGSKIVTLLAIRLAAVRQNLNAHRASNRVGAMLNLSLHQGLKYFSKWIELKEGAKNAGAANSG